MGMKDVQTNGCFAFSGARELGYGDSPLEFPEPRICPLCHHFISPVVVYHHVYEEGSRKLVYGTYESRTDRAVIFFFKCTACTDVFAGVYRVKIKAYGAPYIKLEYITPDGFRARRFDAELEKLSPRFSLIYNQAQHAESIGLNEICGMGYRKALEILVKDYAMEVNESGAEEIAKLLLGDVIKRYIASDQIKMLAERSSWIGNDESHYYRKHEDLGVEELKALIEAILYFILAQIQVRFAENIQRKP